MRFCFLTTFFPPLHFGGDAVFVAHLANALAGRGHHVEVVHCADAFEMLRKGVSPSPMPLDPAVLVHRLHSSWGALSPVVTQMTGRPGFKSSELRRILSAGFDVVHWHNLSLVGGPGALHYAGGVRLCTLHDYWFICPTHILFKYGREACTERACLRCTLAHGRPPQPWRASDWFRESIRQVDRFLAPSAFVERQFLSSPLGIKPTVLPHFIPPPQDRMGDRTGGRTDVQTGVAPAREGYYLFVGRLERAKGLQTILPLFRETGRPLRIAGAGNFEGELRAQAAGAGNIQFLGRVPHAELEMLYSKARATIVPSICFETFGLIALESLQRATPVIASAYGALPEVLAGNPAGFVYESMAELKSILDRLDADPPATLERLGEAGRSAIRRYSVDSHLEQYFRIIQEVRDGNREKGRPEAVDLVGPDRESHAR